MLHMLFSIPLLPSLINLPMLLRELPLDGEICRRRGSMKGVKDEDDLCFEMEFVSDWDWKRMNTFK